MFAEVEPRMFAVFIDTQADNEVGELEQKEGADAGPDDRGNDAFGLDQELIR